MDSTSSKMERGKRESGKMVNQKGTEFNTTKTKLFILSYHKAKLMVLEELSILDIQMKFINSGRQANISRPLQAKQVR